MRQIWDLELIRLMFQFWYMIVNANASSSSDNTMLVFVKSINYSIFGSFKVVHHHTGILYIFFSCVFAEHTVATRSMQISRLVFSFGPA